jgi:hypothetical protein
MAYESVNGIQDQFLDRLEAARAADATEVTGVVPYYVGPWETAARDADTYLTQNDGAHALFICQNPEVEQLLGSYVGYHMRSIAAVTTAHRVLEGSAARHFDYVAGEATAIETVRHTLAPRFLLKLTTERPTDLEANFVVAPSYREAGGRNLPWSTEESVRMYREAYLAAGGPVTRDALMELAKQGEGPYLKRLLQGGTSFQELRNHSSLTDAPYWTGMTLDDKAAYLRQLGEKLGRNPRREDILNEAGPSYTNLTKDVSLAELRVLAGQAEEAPHRWRMEDSTALYALMCDHSNNGKPLKYRDFEKLVYDDKDWPAFETVMKPFREQDAEQAFAILRREAGFWPARNLTVEDSVHYLRYLAGTLGHFPTPADIRAYKKVTGGPSYDALTRIEGIPELRRRAGYEDEN